MPDTRPLVYFMKKARIGHGSIPTPCFYIGNGSPKRIEAHEHDGGEFICAAIGGRTTHEEPVLKHFSKFGIPSPKTGKPGMGYFEFSPEITSFIDRLCRSGFAVRDRSLLDDVSMHPIDHWKLGEGGPSIDYKMTDGTISLLGMEYSYSGISRNNDFWMSEFFAGIIREFFEDDFYDVASEAGANKIIKAPYFYTPQTNGLAQPWYHNVFCNPGSENREDFFTKSRDEIKNGTVKQWIGYMKPDQLTAKYFYNTIQPLMATWYFSYGRTPLIYAGNAIEHKRPRKHANGSEGYELRQSSLSKERSGRPTMGHVFIYVGDNPDRFEDFFAKDGGASYRPSRKKQ